MTTIFALATGVGRSAIAIVRITGAAVPDVLVKLAGSLPPPQRATLRTLRTADGEVLDRSVVLYWPAPGSYTGEDCAELQVHGGAAVIEAVSAALIAAGIRPAEPGEFTRRALLNGKMDLLEAEGIADLVAAETEAQHRLALRQVDGAQSLLVSAWAERLRRVLAWQEALIDFPDEDLPASVESELLSEVRSLGYELAQAADDARHAVRVRDGLVVAIIGAPNVGKSTLINQLAQRDVAITSPTPGTTRDALETWVQMAGLSVALFDTAGLRDTSDIVEAEGIRRARAHADEADLVLFVAEAASVPAKVDDGRTLFVANKIDLAPAPVGWIGVSAATGAGLVELRGELEAALLRLTSTQGSAPLSRARHRAALLEASSCLAAALACTAPELRGEELRLAMHALGRLSGAIGVEDVLDTIFGAFCIGK